jgi:hypothetical protein
MCPERGAGPWFGRIVHIHPPFKDARFINDNDSYMQCIPSGMEKTIGCRDFFFGCTAILFCRNLYVSLQVVLWNDLCSRFHVFYFGYCVRGRGRKEGNNGPSFFGGGWGSERSDDTESVAAEFLNPFRLNAPVSIRIPLFTTTPPTCGSRKVLWNVRTSKIESRSLEQKLTLKRRFTGGNICFFNFVGKNEKRGIIVSGVPL